MKEFFEKHMPHTLEVAKSFTKEERKGWNQIIQGCVFIFGLFCVILFLQILGLVSGHDFLPEPELMVIALLCVVVLRLFYFSTKENDDRSPLGINGDPVCPVCAGYLKIEESVGICPQDHKWKVEITEWSGVRWVTIESMLVKEGTEE